MKYCLSCDIQKGIKRNYSSEDTPISCDECFLITYNYVNSWVEESKTEKGKIKEVEMKLNGENPKFGCSIIDANGITTNTTWSEWLELLTEEKKKRCL